MNMREPTTQWDRPPTDKELNAYYGKDKSTEVRDLIIEKITSTVRTVSHKALSVPYAKHNSNGGAVIAPYSLKEVVTDYGTDPEPLKALLAVLEGSDCPLVAAWRMAMAERFAYSNADEVEELTGEL